MLDDDYDMYWTTDDGADNPWLELDFKESKTLNRLLLAEYIPLGQRISGVEVSYWNESSKEWSPLVRDTTVGYKRILRFEPVTTRRLRIEFESPVPPVISTVAVYNSLKH